MRARVGVPATQVPTTHETFQRAAAVVSEVLPPNFFGRVTLIYENGVYQRSDLNQSIRV